MLLNLMRVHELGPLHIRAHFQGPIPNPRHQPMRVFRLPKWALIWAQGLQIESRPTSPKAYVVGDMSAFWRERNGLQPKNWVEGLWRPTSHLWPTSPIKVVAHKFIQFQFGHNSFKPKWAVDWALQYKVPRPIQKAHFKVEFPIWILQVGLWTLYCKAHSTAHFVKQD